MSSMAARDGAPIAEEGRAAASPDPAIRPAPGRARHEAGLAAEEMAEQAYAARGGKVLARRWRCPAGEIDLVIEMEGVVAFVEVKRWRRPGPDSPVTARQWRRIAAAAGAWLAANHTTAPACRFDAALVEGPFGRLRLIEGAHTPGLD